MEKRPASGMHPHPEALYYHVASDAVASASVEADEFIRKEFIATAFVFSALCLEAFIGQEYEELTDLGEDVERIPAEAKWLLLPLLLGAGETFVKHEAPYNDFHQLIKLRNERMVHFKPGRETRAAGEESRTFLSDVFGDLPLARKYVECVPAMIRELHRLSKGQTALPRFLEGDRYTARVWASAGVAYESRVVPPSTVILGPPPSGTVGEAPGA